MVPCDGVGPPIQWTARGESRPLNIVALSGQVLALVAIVARVACGAHVAGGFCVEAALIFGSLDFTSRGLRASSVPNTYSTFQ